MRGFKLFSEISPNWGGDFNEGGVLLLTPWQHNHSIEARFSPVRRGGADPSIFFCTTFCLKIFFKGRLHLEITTTATETNLKLRCNVTFGWAQSGSRRQTVALSMCANKFTFSKRQKQVIRILIWRQSDPLNEKGEQKNVFFCGQGDNYRWIFAP